LVPKAPPPAYEKMPASSEKGGLPLPIPTKAPRPRRSHLQMFALFALIALIAIPLVWLASGDPGLLSRLDTLPFFSAPHTPHRAHRLQPPPSPYRPGFRRPGFRRPGWAPSRTDEVPPLGAEWHARCDALLTVPEGTHSARLDKLANVLGGAVWIAEPGPSVEYFLGAFGSRAWGPSERPFLIAVHGETVTLLTPAFEEARARLITLPEDVAARVQWVAWAESESPYKVLEDVLGRTDVVLDRAVRTFVADGVRHHIHASDTIDMNTVPAAVAAIRERKDAREIGLLRCANEATLHAIRRTRSRMHIGIRESETRAILYEEMAATGLTDNSALILFGPNAALPHGSGTDRRLGEDEFALIDAGGRWGGYVADITRTFFLPDSQIPEAHQWVWEIVRAAQRAPTNLLRLIDIGEPVLFSWLDDRSRETVKKGMAALGVPPARGSKPDYTVFTHRTGHGIGLEGHESPYVVQGDEGERQVLPGHTFTIEPGVYVPTDSDVGDARIHGLGVRLEDTVVVVEREDGRLGVEWLTGPVERWGDV
jgi:Xaa-Pro aminopeptidase